MRAFKCLSPLWSEVKVVCRKLWGERRGSNPRHLGPQPSALPAELRPPRVANDTGKGRGAEISAFNEDILAVIIEFIDRVANIA